ncbi:GDP-mannose-dependent alpha-(1-6)-phosphatidylinositol monomannoside mannosyltransferase [Symmachiella macrocystis]|uniref:GDP-mannose-dependent alpha-(1-6)-phosphatidylinositol monomannoside mannosyltransferase n=1 Tax=Symmachiella macrocystis TaxID=2527985 RepID=A0A5C6BNK5_9PLAN|nr:glycosyltransferase [Symmachiella macrocystis]TWU12639.1 GDP-mannose-dependent alpha-(1-6)-phosphatidylinositol monomannoside mannosyltransferase [Symmachiella macrocystis]
MSRKIRILALVPPSKTASHSAAYTVLQEELAAFSNAGVEVHVVSPHAKTSGNVQSVKMHPIPQMRKVSHTLRSLFRLQLPTNSGERVPGKFSRQLAVARFELAIEKVLRDEKIDLVYSPFAWPKRTAGIGAAHRVGVPVVVSLRGADAFSISDLDYGVGFDQSVIALTLCRADHVVGVSSALADQAMALGAPAERVSVVLKGVDVDHFSVGNRTESRVKLGLPDVPTILFVGNIVPVKGIDTLLGAYDCLVRECPQAQLVMCGDGSELEKVKEYQREHSETRRVILPGRVSRELIPDYFRAANVFVLPSLSEGSGNVLLEAAACGCPTIGSSVGGIPDYIDDGKTGLLFESQNVQQLAGKIQYVLTNSEGAAQMGQSGREWVVAHFQYQAMIDNLLALFQRVISNSGNPASQSESRLESPSVVA